MQYKEIAASGTTTVKTGPGFLQSIVVNNAGTSWTLQVFDNVAGSGSAIAGASAFAMPAAGSVLKYGCHFSAGLTIVTSGTAGSLTVSYF
jgi:hypothetical protein